MTTDHSQLQTDPVATENTTISETLLKSAVPSWLLFLTTLVLAAGLYPVSRHNYLLFHSLVEIFYVAVAFTVFSIGWNARKFIAHNALMLLAVAYAVIGCIELLHLLTYQGMGTFPGIGANAATQLWIVGRYLEAAAFLAAAVVLNRRVLISPWVLLGTCALVGLLALLSIWPLGLFPDCYIEGVGLTPFKVVSEHVISILLGLAVLIFWSKREHMDRHLLKLLTAAIVLSIVAELAFTLYTDVYGITNFLGHFAKFLSVVLLYRVLVIGTLRSPYAILFRDLLQAKESLHLELEHRRRAEVELLAANRELDAFVRTVSHDLRSPLSPIIGLPELLLEQKRDRIDDTMKKALEDIREQGLRMARILEDLLEFARAGRLIDGVALAPLDRVLRDVLEDLGSRIIAEGIAIEVREIPAIALPRTALFQVFSNLLGNAIKYAGREGGPIEIDAEMEDETTVLITVRDHGPGIPDDEKKRVFDVFYRGANHRESPGTGVGLATVLKIAQCLGGSAWVEETPGGGSTFRLRLRGSDPDAQQKFDFRIP